MTKDELVKILDRELEVVITETAKAEHGQTIMAWPGAQVASFILKVRQAVQELE